MLLFLGISSIGFVSSRNKSHEKSPKTRNKTIQRKRMNVIFFLVDDLGWSDVGYEGSRFYDTPNIDRFAKEGVRFSQAYAASSVCSPTRASIITGEYPARLDMADYLPGRRNEPFQKLLNVPSVQHLPYGQPTLPEVLRENGYATAAFGKWHLGEDSASTWRQGFDLHIPDWNKGWPHGSYFAPFHMKGLDRGTPKGAYLSDVLTTKALTWVQEHQYQPFFLYLAHFAVHDPIQGRGDLVLKYDKKLNKMKAKHEFHGPPYILEQDPDVAHPFSRKKLTDLLQGREYQGFSLLPHRIVKIKQYQDNTEFAAMVESVDESLGRVIAKLKELGIAKNTIIIFFSDNGGMSAANFYKPNRIIAKYNLNEHYSTSNLPLRGGKGWLYEGGIREPMVIYWPGVGEHGTVCNVPVISTDFYSTILDMLGIYPLTNKENGIDGKSLVPLLTGEKSGTEKIKKRALYWDFPQYSNHGAQSPAGAVRYGNYKLINYYENGTNQLFNLKTDMGEHHDLAKSDPQKVKELSHMLHAWLKRVHAVMPKPNPNYNPNLGWPTPTVTKKKP